VFEYGRSPYFDWSPLAHVSSRFWPITETGLHGENHGFLGSQEEIQSMSQAYNACGLPSGKQPHNYGKSPFLMGKSTINCHFQ
jgi:hypothetical protein